MSVSKLLENESKLLASECKVTSELYRSYYYGWLRVYEAIQTTNFITLSSAYENNLGLVIRNELKTSL